MEQKISPRTMAFIRLALFALPLINGILTVAGLSPLPIDEYQLETVLTMVAGLAVACISWYKNNNISKEAQEAQKYLDELKGNSNKQ